MTFLFPLGLLGLIGVPVLILIYLLKNRYTEQTIAATYMWRLSERFLKRRNPLARITGIISLILQILFIVTISLAVAHPIITLPGAAHEYCFVLDGSASMNMETDGKTRFDRAKAEINSIIDDAKGGSVFSLVYVTHMTETVFELEDDRDIIKRRLADLDCSGSNIDLTDSLSVAQRLFNENPGIVTYLLTDTATEENTNVNVINVAKSEANLSLYGVGYTQSGANSYSVYGKAVSYGGNMTTDVEVRSNLEDRVLGSCTLHLEDGKEASFTIDIESESFYSLTVNTTAKDAMAHDNREIVYNIKSENAYTALIVSDTPFLLQSALDAVSNAKVTVMSTNDYKTRESELASAGKTISGYGLYIYDTYTPVALPQDGTIWFVGVKGNVPGTGFSVQGEVELEDGAELVLNQSSSSVIKKLTGGLIGEDVFVKKYIKCGVYGNFSTIFSYLGNPVVFTGQTDSGNRQVVFGFNMHDSNFALSSDYPILLHNLLVYSFPEVIEKAEYYCGENALINVIPGCTAIRVTAPSGSSHYADSASAVCEIALDEVGEYKIALEMSGSEREFYIYSAVPKNEREPIAASLDRYSITGEARDGGVDGEYDPMVIILILAALFFAAEWMVYCYDKYQLR